MKTIYLNIQSKGGSGKSMLTYLQALKHENNDQVAFVDLDSSTKTSSRQLKFIGEKDTERVFAVDIFDNIKKIEREKLFKILEALANNNFNEVYVDFGAPESEQLPRLFSLDFSVDDFKEFEEELEIKIVFNIVLAGGTAYASCFEYLKQVTSAVKGRFEINVYLNELTFKNYDSLIEHLKAFVKSTKGLIKDVRPFGDIHVDRGSGQLVTENIREGVGMEGYCKFPAKLIIKRELAKI